jgi:hypothetical protein
MTCRRRTRPSASRSRKGVWPRRNSIIARTFANPALLDSKIMLTHYSATVLFSAEARGEFVEPDISPIPRYPG